MLGTILKRTLIWGLPLAAAYLFIVFVYGPHGDPKLAWAALLFPLLAMIMEATALYRANSGAQDSKEDTRAAEVVGYGAAILVCVVVFLITWPKFHGGAIGSLVAAGALGRRLFTRAM